MLNFSPQSLVKEWLGEGSDLPSEFRAALEFDNLYSYASSMDQPWKLVSTELRNEKLALYLTSFLGHWGMFRGNAKLKETNLEFAKELTKALLNEKNGLLIPIFSVSFEEMKSLSFDDLNSVLKGIDKFFLDTAYYSPSGTLVSKIMLGLMGNIPAYDRYFNIGIKELKNTGRYAGVKAFGANSIIDLSNWYEGTCYDWPLHHSDFRKGFEYPVGKIVDMCIFQFGKRVSEQG